MARVALTGGAYTARSLIANAQRCVNLFPEINPTQQEPPAPVTQYQRPGKTRLATAADARVVRGAYRSSDGQLFVCAGQRVYYLAPDFTMTDLGLGITNQTTPVSMSDNGITLILVDGTSAGYWIDLAAHSVGTISDVAFYGADRVDILDTFFIFNRPGTNQFYISTALWDGITALDPLDIASKSGYPDHIASVIVMHREVWLIGTLTTEIWYNSGAADFVFQEMPGAFVEHGTIARYSVATQDLAAYWLSQDTEGQSMLVKGAGYQATRISTHAIESEWTLYGDVSDAIGFCYQQGGHTFYQITFPSADKTWVYDEATSQWHERTWTDTNGAEHRDRANCFANAYGKLVVGDWQNGKLYAMDLDAFTDDGDPIVYRRGFPHMMNDGQRVFYLSLIADMEVGSSGSYTPDDPPLLSLRWSDTRGKTFGDPIRASMGAGGEYLTSIQFNRLGFARDRVFEVFWNAVGQRALNGAFIRTRPAGS